MILVVRISWVQSVAAHFSQLGLTFFQINNLKNPEYQIMFYSKIPELPPPNLSRQYPFVVML